MKWFFSLIAIPCFSLPIGPHFAAESGVVESSSPNTLEIRAGHQPIVNWDSFSLAKDERVIFHLASSDSVALNRVIGPSKSEIFGAISSNGQIILLNPAGILIGKDAVIDTQSWMASTFDIQDKIFLATRDWLFTGDSNAAVEIQGTVNANRICVAAREILCGGNLTGDQIDMVAAISARIMSGRIQADSRVLGNSFMEISPSANIVTSKGGEAIFFSDKTLAFDGEVFSPGGFVEISGLESFSFHGKVDTDQTGTLLFDPNEIRIVAAPGMTSPAPLTAFYDGSPSVSSTILNTDLTTLLGMTSVVIQTNAGIVGGSGNISQDVGAPVSWASGTNLTLHANQSILINDLISAGGNGSLITLIADQGSVVLTSTPGVPAIVETNGLYTAGSPSIVVIASNGSLNINSALDTRATVQANSLISCGDIRVIAGSLDFISGTANAANSTCGIQTRRGDVYLTVSGPVNFIGGDSSMVAFEANASVVSGIDPVGAPLGGNLYFTAGSLNLDSTNAVSGGRCGTSLTAYGLGATTGNVIGSVSGDVLFKSSFSLASGSGISSLFEGEIDVAIGGNVTFISSPGPSTMFSGTGIRTLFSGGAGSTRNVHVAIGGNLRAISGGGTDGAAGIGGEGNISVAVRGSAVFQVTNGTGGVSGDCLFSNLGSIEFAAGTVSFLGNSATPLYSHVVAPGNISIASQGAMTLDYGLIESTSGTITMESLNGSLFLSNASRLESAYQLLAMAAFNLEMRDSTAESLNDKIIFVVDNAFPTRPQIGTGSFFIDPSSLIAPLGISIYTARQGQNTIVNSTFNGGTFIPGTLFIDTSQEIWCTYYPGGISTLPFTIFYKDCRNQVTYEATLIGSELQRDLHPYDEAWGWIETFSLNSEPYFIWHRQNMFNHPKSWTALIR
jgi:filamentous hemagglutinin family protein